MNSEEAFLYINGELKQTLIGEVKIKRAVEVLNNLAKEANTEVNIIPCVKYEGEELEIDLGQKIADGNRNLNVDQQQEKNESDVRVHVKN